LEEYYKLAIQSYIQIISNLFRHAHPTFFGIAGEYFVVSPASS